MWIKRAWGGLPTRTSIPFLFEAEELVEDSSSKLNRKPNVALSSSNICATVEEVDVVQKDVLK
jgi:hypothetical protein